MGIQEARSMQDLNLVDRFLFDETVEVLGMYDITVNILLGNKVTLLDKVHAEKKFRVSPVLWSARLDVVSSVNFNLLNDTCMILISSQALIQDNRLEDLICSTTDLKFQKKLLHEYHLLV